MTDYLLDKNSATTTQVLQGQLWGKESSRLKKWYFRMRYGGFLDTMPDVKAIERAWAEEESKGEGASIYGLTLWRDDRGRTIMLIRFGPSSRWHMSYLGNYHSAVPEAFGGYDQVCNLEMASLDEAIGLLVR